MEERTVTIPHFEEMFPHQIKWLKDDHRFQVVCAHRRSRKTTTAIEKLVSECLNPDLPKKVYWLIMPTYNEAKTAVWVDPSMLFRIIPPELIERTNETELTVYFKNGSVLSLKGSDQPERLLGAGPQGVVLDEYAEQKPEIWERIIQPILRANHGWAWFVSTPKGTNHFYHLLLKGQKKNPEWKSWLLKASQSGVIPKEQLERARKDMPDSLYQQEWECAFLEGEGSVFRSVKRIATAKPEKPQQNHLYLIGCDLAKLRDWTVMAVYDRQTNSQVYQDRFKTIEWPFIKKKIIETAKHYNHALVKLDATGLGDVVCDDLLRAGVAVEPYKFTEYSKKELIEKLSIYIEQQRIKILPIKESIDELEAFTYEIGPTGRIKYGAPQGMNDDIVIAHGLAVYDLFPRYKEKEKKPLTPFQRSFLKAKMKWEEPDFDDALSSEEATEWWDSL